VSVKCLVESGAAWYANVLERAIQAGHSVLLGTADTGMLANETTVGSRSRPVPQLR
jgi:hypothetical protein